MPSTRTVTALPATSGPTPAGVPVRMTFGNRPWRLAVVPDPNNLFLIVQQAPQ